MAEYIEREAVNCLMDKFIGYLDEDMIYRIKQKIKGIPSADVQEIGCRKQKPIHIIGKPKSGARIFTTRVTPNGIIIDNILYGIRDLINGHCYEKVKIKIVNDIATVFDIETGEQIIWFELYLHKGVNCKHSFYPIKTEDGDTPDMIQKAVDEVSAAAAKKFKEKIQNLSTERFGSVNKIIKYLAEHNAFALENGKLTLIDENIPEIKNNNLTVCNSKTKMILKIMRAINEDDKKH